MSYIWLYVWKNTIKAPCLNTPVETTQLTGKNVKYSKIFWGETRSRFSTELARKPTGEGWCENPAGWTVNILDWIENIYSKMIKKTGVWTTRKCQKPCEILH